jgi:hypothetical protein
MASGKVIRGTFGRASTTDASVDERIRFAIANRRLIQFVYKGAARVAEPHDYGIANGRVRMLVYQVGGVSKGPIPGWRMIDVGEVVDLITLEHEFSGTRGNDEQSHKRWDELFCRVK